MKPLVLTCILTLALSSALPAHAAPLSVDEAEKQPLVRAMKDELQRSLGLALPGMDKPYFISYLVEDSEAVTVAGEQGGVIMQRNHRSRTVRVDVRVGDYAFDNSNFLGGGMGTASGQLCLDDDYDTLRQRLWLVTDRAYKGATQALAEKKAALANKPRDKDDPGDFSKEPAHKEVLGPAPKLADGEDLQRRVRKLGELYKEFPQVQEGYVVLSGIVSTRTFVSSEGSFFQEPDGMVQFMMAAGTQAEDGMPLSHYAIKLYPAAAGLPDSAALEGEGRRMLTELTTLRAAPKLADYNGPVLFEGMAAGHIMGQLLAYNLAGTPGPWSRDERVPPSSQFVGKEGKKVLPTDFQVTDDPTLTAFAKQPLLSGYRMDDEGVVGQKVQIIQDGKLKSLLMTRTPSKEQPRSNGHARSARFGSSNASPSNLVVTTKKGLAAKALRKKLLELAKKADEKFGIVMRQLPNHMATSLLSGVSSSGWSLQGGAAQLYKITPDGKETPVRGLNLRRLDVNDMKRIKATGKDPGVYNLGGPGVSTGGGGRNTLSVVSPDLLFEEVELQEIKGGQTTMPLLPRP